MRVSTRLPFITRRYQHTLLQRTHQGYRIYSKTNLSNHPQVRIPTHPLKSTNPKITIQKKQLMLGIQRINSTDGIMSSPSAIQILPKAHQCSKRKVIVIQWSIMIMWFKAVLRMLIKECCPVPTWVNVFEI